MKRFNVSEGGMILISILMLTVILIMLTTSMLLITTNSLNITGNSDRKAIALDTAQAGVEYAFYRLNMDPSWGDPNHPSTDITENIGDDQEFTIVFNTGVNPHSCNNLRNFSPDTGGPAPAYSASIICKGTYKGYTVKTHAVFVRDDLASYPLISGGEDMLYLGAYMMAPSSQLNIKGTNSQDPGHLHSNGTIFFSRGDERTAINLNEGFASACDNITFFPNSTGITFKTKQNVSPEQTANINVPQVLGWRDPNCVNIPADTFYLVGFFECEPSAPNAYSPNHFCIPHGAPSPTASDDPGVHYNPFKIGVVAVNENSFSSFLDKYSAFWSTPEPPAAGSENRNLYDAYPGLTFWDYNDTVNFPTIESQLGMDIVYDPNTSTINMSLNKDLYMPTNCCLFETNKLKTYGVYGNLSFPPFQNAKVKLDLNDHAIYAKNSLLLGIPVTGKGALVADDTVDFVDSYSPTMAVLAGNTIKMIYREEEPNATIEYNGILYADQGDIFVQRYNYEEDKHITQTSFPTFNFNGSMLSNKFSGGGESSLMSCPHFYNSSSIALCPTGTQTVNIALSDSGMDILVGLRKYNFRVKKQSFEILR